MAIRDTWHRALVYFGLAEDHHDDYAEEELYEPDTSVEEEMFEPRQQRRQSNVRRLERRRPRDEIDEIFSDDEGPAPTRTLRPVDNGGGIDVQVHLVTPNNFNDAQEIADRFKQGVPVILNLQTSDAELSKRLIDFGSGLTYALDGGMQKIADK